MFFIQGILVVYYSFLKMFLENNNFQKILKFFYILKWRKLECGIFIGFNLFFLINFKYLLNIYFILKVGFEIFRELEVLYVYLLFGLVDKSLGMLEVNFFFFILLFFDVFYQYWFDIADDIERGEVDLKFNIDEFVRKELNVVLILNF